MRRFGFVLLIIGFLWIALSIAAFTMNSYMTTMWHSKNLPTAQHAASGDTILRDDAARSLWRLRDDLRTQRLELLIPALMMLVGGWMTASTTPHAAPKAA
jgi:hypothetical protein